ncbi:MAG: hypothetical protein IJ209_05570 [Bacteroidaceae bacterium]|nr:hypothetical protein [Bacteroidaceae bacterium]
MKKYLFSAIAMAMMSATLLSCSNDDNNNDNSGSSTMPTPQFESLVTNIVLDEPVKVRPSLDEGRQLELSEITLAEDGIVFFQIKDIRIDTETDKPVPTDEDKVIVVPDKAKSFDGSKLVLEKHGSIEIIEITRATIIARVNVNVQLDVPGYGTVVFETEAENLPGATVNKPTTPTDKAQLDLFRTWKIRGIMCDITGDVTVSKEFTGGYLKPICDEAIRQGATLTEEEQAEFNKTIQSITISRAGIFNITYTDGTCLANTYTWQAGQTSFNISILTDDMANKYISEGSVVSYEIKGNRCNLKLDTEIKGNKNYRAVLILQLEY